MSTGEVSGDLQGAMLVEALYRQAQAQGIDLEIIALGGDRMAAAGATLLGNTSAIGSIGVFEALPYILPTLLLQRQAKRYLLEHPPDLVILIDYMGANLSVGHFVRQSFPKLPIVYYIAPQEWVWSLNDRNTQQIRAVTDRLLAIFPEEARYYEKQGATVEWVGHPLVDRLQISPSREDARNKLGIADQDWAVVLSPASRKQELKYLLPPMFTAAQRLQQQFPQIHFWVPLALDRYRPALEKAIAAYGLRATIVPKELNQVAIAAADLALTKSGTTNLEMALLNVPQVVIYRLSALTAWLARYVIKLKISFASPVNLVPMRAVVPELLQDQVTAEALYHHAVQLLQGEARQKMLQDYVEVRQSLGEPGVCDRAARSIFSLLK
ncbi:lipid-A-disaccharide synthase [Alkalinema sp. FACHB-956]|uniref:lipid-A-disaccharide synthase n=1 Tax=Alkalinema sp. FACHB-956 TaxID=2692768 RepID=UPI001682579C|nr:lipid-A-disaccharide synthase [Alkalinema sp. FACHB-956]MBD2327615.1 lipid-A-disaccharide synthase [Alkalinema sp. FACHB-956]